jgi:predicted phage terminase large subunit-like protein
MDDSLLNHKARLLGSFIYFTQVFYKLRTGRDFVISQPISRESHHITIAKSFTNVLRGTIQRLLINIEPGSGKSELCKHFIAWALAHYPDSNFIYLSYSHELAAKHTYGVKQIISIPYYRNLFGVEIARDSSAKDNFKTIQGGVIYASGSAGTITGQDAGLPHLDRFSGAVIMDDMHKPDEVHSDTMRATVINNYFSTIIHRARGNNVAFVFMGQRLHEDDLAASLISGKDGYNWDKIVLKSIDNANNVLYPEVHSRQFLETMRDTAPYEFASQYQQDPQPAGGAIFKPEWFPLLDEEPQILTTFITADTAETEKTYNDATVFSFWGIYKIKQGKVQTDILALHWLDCYEIRVEPKDLQPEFEQFYFDCMQYPVKPSIVAIEKKSTGVTLSSILKTLQGIQVIDIERTRASGNKASRYLEMQPYVSSKRISFSVNSKHSSQCIEHMRKITANDTHRHDDICDTAYDAVKLGLINKSILVDKKETQTVLANSLKNHNRLNKLKANVWQR